MKKLAILVNGILKENPVLVLVLGTCPTLAVTAQASNAIGMGAATLFVLLGSNVVLSLLRKVIPSSVRIPCYIVIISAFVTIVQMLLQAFAVDIYNALGIFLPLIVVNCIILGRAEMFASKNTVLDSALDAIGMGLGFTLALLLLSSFREIFGSGSWFGIDLTFGIFKPVSVLTQPAGGFFTFGLVLAATAFFETKKKKKQVTKEVREGCSGCPNAAACGGSCGEN